MEIEEKICDTCQRLYQHENDFLHGTSQWRLCNEGNLWFNCSCASTLMIEKGKFSWYSPDKFLSSESRSVFNRIASVKDVPHIPMVIMELQRKVFDQDFDAKALAQAVRVDPFLASEVLRISSNLKNLRAIDKAKIKSLEHSITYIGRKTLSEMLIVASITSFKIKTKVFTIDDLWQTALHTGVLAEALATKFNPALRADEVYLAGALANIGKIVSALCFPEQTDQIYQKTKNKEKSMSWLESEKIYDNADHCILGEIGSSIWGLPKYIGEVARWHHTIPTKTGFNRNQATISEVVMFANILTPWFCSKMSSPDEKSILEVAGLFGLSEDQLEDLVISLRKIPIAS